MMNSKLSLPPAHELRRSSRRRISAQSIALILSAAFLAYCVLSTGILFPQPKEANGPAATSANSYRQLIPDGYGSPIAVTISSSGESFTLRTNDGLFVIDGEDAALNQHAAQEILSAGASILARRRLTGAPAEYGISDSTLQARFVYANGSELTLHLGQQVPTGEGWYAAISNDDAVYIVNNALQRKLSLRKDALYALPTLAERYNAQTLSSVTIEFSNEAPITIARVTKANHFNTKVELTQPIHYPANSERAAEVYLALDKLQLTGVAALHGTDAAWGLANPIVQLTLRDKTETRLRIGAHGDQYTARLDDDETVYYIDPESLVFLNDITVPWLAEQLPGLVMLNQVARIQVRTQDASLSFDVDQSSKTYALDGQSLTDEVFLPVYQQMIGLLIERYVQPDEQARTPRLQLEYTFKDSSSWTLTIAQYDENYDLIIRDQCSCFLISRSKTDALIQSLLSLKAQ